MSDEVLKTLSAENAKFRAQKARLREQLEAVRAELEQAKAQVGDYGKRVGALEAERDEFRSKLEASPSEHAAEVERLRAELTGRDHRDAFKTLYEDKDLGLNPAVGVEKLWKLIDYKAEGDVAPDQIRERVAGLRESDPYLFQPAGETPAALPGMGKQLQAGPGAGRGLPDTSGGRFVVRRADYSDPAWMHRNQARVAAASADGTLTLVD